MDLQALDGGEAIAVMLNGALYRALYKYTKAHARQVVVNVGPQMGLQAWRDLCYCARQLSAIDEHAEFAALMQPARAPSETALGLHLNSWVARLREIEQRSPQRPVGTRSKKV